MPLRLTRVPGGLMNMSQLAPLVKKMVVSVFVPAALYDEAPSSVPSWLRLVRLMGYAMAKIPPGRPTTPKIGGGARARLRGADSPGRRPPTAPRAGFRG